jgi:hypothetical protein
VKSGNLLEADKTADNKVPNPAANVPKDEIF